MKLLNIYNYNETHLQIIHNATTTETWPSLFLFMVSKYKLYITCLIFFENITSSIGLFTLK